MIQVMIVEDEKIIRQSLKKIIDSATDREFAIVGEAKDGADALQLLQQISPQIVITDIRMPVMDGLSFIEEMNTRGLAFEIVILSGYDDFAYAKQAMRLGVSEYLLKPIDTDELIQTLHRVRNRINRASGLVNDQLQWLRIEKEHVQQTMEAIATLDAAKVKQHVRRFFELAATYMGAHLSMKDMFATFVDMLAAERQQKRELSGIDMSARLEFTQDGERNIDILERYLLSIVEELGTRRNWAARLIAERAIDYIERNYFRMDLQLQHVADDLGISVFYLSRTFKAETDRNFIRYLTEYRLNKAKQLMGAPDAKLQTICSQVGYEEYAHFSRTFKKHFGLSPTDYIRLIR
ncbi:response regulator transcription factor [Paenibacillus cymbidii]|uniref:response regulator transcription factor n=1 Tax=Paenibacillus cymbidii TaxID=1639034 RepID=UPI0014369746|nr:response regulator [Paenibacillus cymbidii]